MSTLDDPAVRAAVARLRAAPKYRQIHDDTIVDIVVQERRHGGSGAELERRARLRLHRVVAGYLATARPTRALRGLDEAAAGGTDALRAWCRGVLGQHFSTAERLDDLDDFYPALLDLTGPAARIADLACALNPFTLPWLRAASPAAYTGYDLNLSYVDLAGSFFARGFVHSEPAAAVVHRDILVRPEEIRADVALLLKTYHCIEDRQPGAALRLVETVGADRVVVSFPSRTMSGRVARFAHVHIGRLTDLAHRRNWALRRGGLSAEEFVVVVKVGPDGQAT